MFVFNLNVRPGCPLLYREEGGGRKRRLIRGFVIHNCHNPQLDTEDYWMYWERKWAHPNRVPSSANESINEEMPVIPAIG